MPKYTDEEWNTLLILERKLANIKENAFLRDFEKFICDTETEENIDFMFKSHLKVRIRNFIEEYK